MSIIKNNINYVLAQGRKYLSKVKTQYQNFLRRVQDDGGQLLNIFEDYKDYINNPERIYQLPMARKVGKLYRLDEDDYTVIRNGGAWEFTRDGVYREVAANVPRFDWTNGKQELLVEGQSTNLIDYSMDSSYWRTGNGASVGINMDSNSPFGNNTASVFNQNSGDIFKSFNINDGNPYVFSAFYKGVPGESVSMTFYDYSNPFAVREAVTFNGKWQRLSVFFPSGVKIIYICDNRTNIATASSFLCTQWQLEEGTEATSPIITNGSIVTRPADIITNSQGQLEPGRYDTL